MLDEFAGLVRRRANDKVLKKESGKQPKALPAHLN